MKKILYIFASLIFAGILITGAGAEEICSDFDGEAEVVKPSFDVTLNGVKYDSTNAKHPLFVYKDITYLPLTDEICGFMGLKTLQISNAQSRASSKINAFFVGNSDIKTSEMPQICGDVNSLSFKVQTYRSTPNAKGAQRDKDGNLLLYYTLVQNYEHNGDEAYPFLFYRETFYLPLTWDFAYEKLGWEYEFDLSAGLVIDSRKALRPELNFYAVKDWLFGNITRGMHPLYYYGHDYYIEYNINGWWLTVYDRSFGESQRYTFDDYVDNENQNLRFYYTKPYGFAYESGILTINGAWSERIPEYGEVKYDVILVIDVFNGAVTIIPQDKTA